MVTNTIVRCCEEAAELGDRFPELPEADVLEHVSDVLKLSDALQPDWAISRCVMQSFEFGGTTCTTAQATEEGLNTARAWGIIPKGFAYDPNRLY